MYQLKKKNPQPRSYHNLLYRSNITPHKIKHDNIRFTVEERVAQLAKALLFPQQSYLLFASSLAVTTAAAVAAVTIILAFALLIFLTFFTVVARVRG